MNKTSSAEGVVKYQAHHKISAPMHADLCRDLISWRQILFDLRLIGQNPNLYGGAGYGNISRRVESSGKPVFWITGTQTGGLSRINSKDFSKVEKYDASANTVHSSGPVAASSEAMTHGAVYEADPGIQFVFHAHSSVIWKNAKALQLMETHADVEYGTPEMALCVAKLSRNPQWNRDQAFTMAGHEDGVFTFGSTAEIAGSRMICLLAKAMAMTVD